MWPKICKVIEKTFRYMCVKLVETNKCNIFDMVYMLLKMALVLPLVTASVECIFLAMKFVKS
jgi:hypothetical protein